MTQMTVGTGASSEALVPGLSRNQSGTELAERDKTLFQYRSRRLYYDGEQYEEENEDFAKAAGYKAKNKRLPEHLRKHAYSSHVQEAVDILADMLAEGIVFDGPHSELLNDWWASSGMDERADDWFREALILGDVYAVPDWDSLDDRMIVDLWEAESVWPVYDQRDWRRLDHWYRFGTVTDDLGEHEEMRLFMLQPTDILLPAASDVGMIDIELGMGLERFVIHELVEYVFVADELREINRLRMPKHPLVHGRGDTRHKLRSMFGDSMITKKVMGSADRFNAISQLGFRVARQNSFATVAVVGDSAALGAGGRDDSIAKDVADVLKFPGGTNVSTITLPTDPRMIESQQHLLERNLYREFGLTKNDLSEFGGLGTVSGYALEVVNRKDRATQNRIRKNAIAGIRQLVNLMLDVHAVKSAEADGRNWWEVDPEEVYPDRQDIEIVIGSGDIVDTTADRDDFTAGLVSRRHVLRRKGLGKEEIDLIEQEIDAQAQRQMDMQTEAQNKQTEVATQAAIEQAKATASLNRTSGSISGNGTQSGSTQKSS